MNNWTRIRGLGEGRGWWRLVMGLVLVKDENYKDGHRGYNHNVQESGGGNSQRGRAGGTFDVTSE